MKRYLGSDVMKLYPHQQQALEIVANNNKCAFYLDMGL
jgi:hypothetical protein